MGTLIFDFLRESPLFDGDLIDAGYGGLTDHDLQKELNRYREYVIGNLGALRKEIAAVPGELRLYGGKSFDSLPQLTQAAFYLDQVVLPDPLFPHSVQLDEVRRQMNIVLGGKDRQSVNRQAIANSARWMRMLTPMVAANYVKFFPVTYFLEREEIPLLAAGEGGFASTLPSEALKIYRDRAAVRSARYVDGAIVVGRDLQVGRMISIGFDADSNGYLYRLSGEALEIVDQEQRLVRMTIPQLGSPEPPVAKEDFTAWVSQSIDQAALSEFRDLYTQHSLSVDLGLSYLTDSEVTAAILGINAKLPDIKTFTATTLLNMQVPFFENTPAADVMSVRQSDGQAFSAFRRELERSVRELRLESDPEKRALKLENAIHELTEVQVGAVEQKVRQLRKGVLADAVIATASLAAGIPAISFLTVTLAAARGYKTWRDFQDKVTTNPAYFLWKATKGRR